MIAVVKRIENIEIVKDMIVLRFLWNESKVLPGQFFMIGPESFENKDFILNRPFSVADFKNNLLEFRIRIAGKFTNYLQTLERNDKLRLIGALGNGKNEFSGFEKILLIGGGIGIAPLIFFYNYLEENGYNVTLFFGIKSIDFLHYLPDNLREKTYIATEDGSFGSKGFVTDILKRMDLKNSMVLACGPKPMYNSLKKFTSKCCVNVLLEERMACGFGVCLGCVTSTKDGYKRVCMEGPVFELNHLTNL